MTTMDYDKFSFLEGNRDVDPKGRPDLRESFTRKALDTAIDVNDKLQIIDGQNRFVIRKSLGLPILYVIHNDWGIEEVAILNSNQKNWIAKDFVNAYIEQGHMQYKTYKDFDEKFGFGPPVNLMLLCGGRIQGGDLYGKFKNGNLKITSLPFAEESAKKLLEFKDYYSGYKRTKFCSAMVQLFKNKDYEHKVMMKKMEYLSRKLVHCTSTQEYAILLKELYNYKSQGSTKRL